MLLKVINVFLVGVAGVEMVILVDAGLGYMVIWLSDLPFSSKPNVQASFTSCWLLQPVALYSITTVPLELTK